MEGVARKALTVDFHEPGFVARIAQENQFGPWFQLSDDEKQQLGSPWGPQNPQALNRYSYVLNSPMRWTDPTGHDSCHTGPGCGGVVYNNTNHSIWVIGNVRGPCNDEAPGFCEQVAVEVLLHKSSADVGVYDADAVIIGLGSTKNSCTCYKLVNHEKATVSTNTDETTTIVAERKSIWTGAITEAERFRRFVWVGERRVQERYYSYIRDNDGQIHPVI
jgi:hypothetical protein